MRPGNRFEDGETHRDPSTPSEHSVRIPETKAVRRATTARAIVPWRTASLAPGVHLHQPHHGEDRARRLPSPLPTAGNTKSDAANPFSGYFPSSQPVVLFGFATPSDHDFARRGHEYPPFSACDTAANPHAHLRERRMAVSCSSSPTVDFVNRARVLVLRSDDVDTEP